MKLLKRFNLRLEGYKISSIIVTSGQRHIWINHKIKGRIRKPVSIL